MSTEFLDERRKSLEDEFFHRENQKKLEAMKDKLSAQESRDELRRASGMNDDAVLDRLVALGIRGQTIAALSLVPLIVVAWADGSIQANERSSILESAKGKGIDAGGPGHEILSSWLDHKPEPALFDAWEGYIKTLVVELTDEQRKLMRTQILGFARMIAESSGGILGFGKVSASEEKVLARIDGAFH